MKIALVTACIALSFFGLSSFSKAEEPKKPHTMAVLTFKNLRSSTETDWIGEGATETLTTKLAGVPGLVVVERSQIKKMLEEQTFQQIGVTDPTNAVKLGKVLGAERIVIGTYAGQGESVLFNVRVVDVETAQILSTASVTGTTGKILDLLFQLAEAVIQSFDKTVVVVDARPVVQEAPVSHRIVLAEEDRQHLRESGVSIFAALKARSVGNRAGAYAGKGEFDLAIQDADRAIELNPNSYSGYGNRAVAYYCKGEFDLAIQDGNRVIEINPNRFEGYINRAFAYAAKGECDRAIQDANHALKLNRKHPGCYVARAYAYLKKGDYGLAMQDCATALKINSKDANVYSTRAQIYFEQHEYEKAWEDVRVCKKLGGGVHLEKTFQEFFVKLTKASGISE